MPTPSGLVNQMDFVAKPTTRLWKPRSAQKPGALDEYEPSTKPVVSWEAEFANQLFSDTSAEGPDLGTGNYDASDTALQQGQTRESGEEDESDSQAVWAFVQKWGLDMDSRASLLQLGLDDRAKVMAKFIPKPHTRDVISLFRGFVGSFLRSPGHTGSPNAKSSAGRVHTPFAGIAASPEPFADAERLATAESAPRDGASSRRDGFAGAAHVVPDPGHDSSVFLDLQGFSQMWGLDATSVLVLEALPREQQEIAVMRFAPKSHTRDVNSLFQSFAKSLSSEATPGRLIGGQVQDDISCTELGIERAAAFVEKWGLDSEALEILMKLDNDSQSRLYKDFSPKQHTRDVNALFRGFVRSLSTAEAPKRPRGGQGESETVYWDVGEDSSAAAFVAQWNLDATALETLMELSPDSRTRLYESFPPKLDTQDLNVLFRAVAKSLRIEDWCAAWCFRRGLDKTCLDAMLALSPEQIEHAMVGFSPKPDTRNPVGLFMSYCRSLSTGVGQGKSKGAEPSWKRARVA